MLTLPPDSELARHDSVIDPPAPSQEDWTALGDFLVDQGFVSPRVLEISMQVQRRTGIRLSSILIASRELSPEALAAVMTFPLQLPYVDLEHVPADDGAYELVPADFAASHDAVPFACNTVRRELRVAFAQPTEGLIARFETKFEVRVIGHRADRDKIKEYAFRLYNPLIIKRLVASRQRLYNEHTRIGVGLAARGLVDPQAFTRAVSLQQTTGMRFGAVLAASGALSPLGEREFLSTPIPAPHITLSHVRVDEEVKAMIDEEHAVRYRCAPLLHASGLLYVAFPMTPTERMLRELDDISGACVSPFVASRLEVLQFISRLYPSTAETFSAEIKSLASTGRHVPTSIPEAFGPPMPVAGLDESGEASESVTAGDAGAARNGRPAPGAGGRGSDADTDADGDAEAEAEAQESRAVADATKKSDPKRRSTRRRYGHYR
jgi:hypothetical protein